MDAAEILVAVTAASPFETSIDEQWISAAVRAAIGTAGNDTKRPTDYLFDGRRGLAISVRVADDEEMHRLNSQYRGIDRTTDVLSFAFLEESAGPTSDIPPDWPLQLGDVIVSWPYAERQAEELGHPSATEIAWLIIHGTLQLLGYHHNTAASAEHMEHVERRALEALGFSVD